MDADDICRSGRLERQLAAFDQDPALIAVGSSVEFIDSDGDPLLVCKKPESHEMIDQAHMRAPEGSAITHPSVMIRTTSLKLVEGYRDEFWPAEDADLFLRLAEKGLLMNIPEALLQYRVHAESVSASNRAAQLDALYRASVSAADRRGTPLPPRRHLANNFQHESVAYGHQKMAWWALSGGHVRTARKHARKAIASRPFMWSAWKALACSMRPR
jgi:hypothetical protein